MVEDSSDGPEDAFGNLYSQLQEQCTVANLGDLIRDIQSRNEDAKREINVSCPKPEMVENVRRAVDKNYITVDEVRGYLFDAEEHGNQHVFMFRPKDESAKSQIEDFEQVKDSLLRGAGVSSFDLPRYAHANGSLTLVDIRRAEDGSAGWIAKWYGHEFQEKTDDRIVEHLDDGRTKETRIVSRREIRTVMVVRWRPGDLLEIRVDRKGSRGISDIKTRLGAIWEALRPSIPPSGVVVWSMLNAAESLIHELAEVDASGSELNFSLGSITLRDQLDGKLSVDPKDPSESVSQEPNRISFLQSALVGGAKASGLAVFWRKTETTPDSFLFDLTTVIQGSATNELVFGARITGEVYDYVIGEIRRRN